MGRGDVVCVNGSCGGTVEKATGTKVSRDWKERGHVVGQREMDNMLPGDTIAEQNATKGKRTTDTLK